MVSKLLENGSTTKKFFQRYGNSKVIVNASSIKDDVLDPTPLETPVKVNNPEEGHQKNVSKFCKLRPAVCKSKGLVYLGHNQLRAKDASAWTQPKDPLQVKVDMLSEKANVFGEDTYAQAYVDIESNFITSSERIFVQSYANQSFENLVRTSETTKLPGCTKERLTLLDWFYSFS